jgi:hypothetical protein
LDTASGDTAHNTTAMQADGTVSFANANTTLATAKASSPTLSLEADLEESPHKVGHNQSMLTANLQEQTPYHA